MKTVDEIFGEMLVSFGARTGMEVDQGCDLAVRLYAAAAQIYALYLQADWVARQAFPPDSGGGLSGSPRPAERAGAEAGLPCGGDPPLLCGRGGRDAQGDPTGHRMYDCGTGAVRDHTAAVLPAGQLQVDVPARALLAGSSGNAAAGTVLSMAVAPVGVRRCDNPEPFLGGSDGETDSELRKRVLDTFQRLPNGAKPPSMSRGPCPLMRWPPPPSFHGAGGSVLWTWWCPPTAGRRTLPCWSRFRPISRAGGRSLWTSRCAPRSR